ncbi:MAG: LysR family transcriptional regulator [Phycisphaeraceae bacterium]
MQTLRLYSDVARCHSFSEAAARHGITQSAASQRIGQLEKRLGVQLLDRSVRPLALTEAGQRFLDGCEQLLRQYDDLERHVTQLRDEPEGSVRVAAIYSAGVELLNQIRERFEAEHPRISVQIRYDQPDAVYGAVRECDCDMGILSYPQRWRNVGVITLRNEKMAVVCRPDHPLAREQRVHASALSPHELVTFDHELPVSRRIRRYLRENGASPRVTDSFDNIDTIKNAVTVTQRFAILPKRTAGREVAAGTLAVVELTPELVRPLGIIFRRRHKQGPVFSPAAQQFVDYLLRHAGPDVDTIDLASPATVSAGTVGAIP